MGYALGRYSTSAAGQPNIHYARTGTANGWICNNLQPGTSSATRHSIFKELDAAGLTSKLYYGLPQGALTAVTGEQ